jgi:phosphoribosylamine--glycine ligase
MGAFTPSPLVDDALRDRILAEIVRPVLDGLILHGSPYRGVLYCGLMITREGPKVIEFNVRFGDPEAQVILPMIDQPLTPILWAAATGVLRSSHVAIGTEPHVGVVLAAAGYPGEVRTGQRIDGVDDVDDALVFFAGVKEGDGTLVTSGGRVMTVVGRGATFAAAIENAYTAVSRIRFDGMQYRRDIGQKAIL